MKRKGKIIIINVEKERKTKQAIMKSVVNKRVGSRKRQAVWENICMTITDHPVYDIFLHCLPTPYNLTQPLGYVWRRVKAMGGDRRRERLVGVEAGEEGRTVKFWRKSRCQACVGKGNVEHDSGGDGIWRVWGGGCGGGWQTCVCLPSPPFPIHSLPWKMENKKRKKMILKHEKQILLWKISLFYIWHM